MCVLLPHSTINRICRRHAYGIIHLFMPKTSCLLRSGEGVGGRTRYYETTRKSQSLHYCVAKAGCSKWQLPGALVLHVKHFYLCAVIHCNTLATHALVRASSGLWMFCRYPLPPLYIHTGVVLSHCGHREAADRNQSSFDIIQTTILKIQIHFQCLPISGYVVVMTWSESSVSLATWWQSSNMKIKHQF